MNPPIRTRADNEALWGGLRAGHVGTVASDHACCMERQRRRLWAGLPGFADGAALLTPCAVRGFHKREFL